MNTRNPNGTEVEEKIFSITEASSSSDLITQALQQNTANSFHPFFSSRNNLQAHEFKHIADIDMAYEYINKLQTDINRLNRQLTPIEKKTIYSSYSIPEIKNNLLVLKTVTQEAIQYLDYKMAPTAIACSTLKDSTQGLLICGLALNMISQMSIYISLQTGDNITSDFVNSLLSNYLISASRIIFPPKGMLRINEGMTLHFQCRYMLDIQYRLFFSLYDFYAELEYICYLFRIDFNYVINEIVKVKEPQQPLMNNLIGQFD